MSLSKEDALRIASLLREAVTQVEDAASAAKAARLPTFAEADGELDVHAFDTLANGLEALADKIEDSGTPMLRRRVTLDLVIRPESYMDPFHWDWRTLLDLADGESVTVVESVPTPEG